jgi:predicted cobalt transporter CbtA
MERTNANSTALAIFFIATAVVLIGGLVVTAVTQQAAFAQPTNPKKVTYCHNTPGNDNDQTVTTGAPSVAAHVRNHGDPIGACQPEPAP